MPVTARPCSSILPSSGRSKPAIKRSVVVLPEPDGPSSVKNSPPAISRSTPSTATTSPYVLRTPTRRTSGVATSELGVAWVSESACVAKRVLQEVEPACELGVRDRERDENADDVAEDPAREQHETSVARRRRHARRNIGCRLRELERHHRPNAAHLSDQPAPGRKPIQAGANRGGELLGMRLEPRRPHLLEHRDCSRARNRIAPERAAETAGRHRVD